MSEVVSTDLSMDAHPSSFQCWKSARTTLTHAIDDYLTASVGLCDALSAPACHPSSRHSLEQTLSEIDLELSSLQSEEEMLKQMRVTLANERNRSTTLTPVHKLPLEILATIFAISSSRYNKYDRTNFFGATCVSPTVLAGVCSSWRQLALRCPSLWSCIDLIIGDELDLRHSMHVMLWVERSQNVPLYVNIRDHNRRDAKYNVTWHDVDGLTEFLAPLMHRVCALDISGALEENEVLSSVMECWTENGSTDIKKTLQVVNCLKHCSEEVSDFLFGSQSDVGEFNTFFQTIDRLFLRNCGISEFIMFHEGLVELHLEGIIRYHYPTQQDFVAILAACPRLHVLALGNYWVKPSEEVSSPVTLNHLQSLSLEADDPGYRLVALVLPLLLIGSDTLAVSLTLEDDPRFFAEVKAFFDRTKVMTLCVRDRQYQSSLAALLSCPIPYLETLAIEHFDVFGPAFQHFSEANGDDRGKVLWPRLHTLYLKDPSIDGSCLQKLVLLHPSIKKVHIYRPRPVGKYLKFMTGEECGYLDGLMDMVDDYHIDFGSGNGPMDAWDFVSLEE